jgi:ABC-type tungstate transport system substrate-binding protein
MGDSSDEDPERDHLATLIDGLSTRVGYLKDISARRALACSLGLVLGAWLGVARFAGRGVVLAFLNTALALPSVVVGLVVYLLLSRSGPLGSWGILFTPTAMVIAQSILVVPLIAALARRLVLSALADGGDQLRSLGAGPLTTAALLLMHERLGVMTALLTGFGRAIAEVGAVMIVGGNSDGFNRSFVGADGLLALFRLLCLGSARGFHLRVGEATCAECCRFVFHVGGLHGHDAIHEAAAAHDVVGEARRGHQQRAAARRRRHGVLEVGVHAQRQVGRQRPRRRRPRH